MQVMLMHGSRFFARGGGVQARLSENSYDNLFLLFLCFSPQLNLVLHRGSDGL